MRSQKWLFESLALFSSDFMRTNHTSPHNATATRTTVGKLSLFETSHVSRTQVTWRWPPTSEEIPIIASLLDSLGLQAGLWKGGYSRAGIGVQNFLWVCEQCSDATHSKDCLVHKIALSHTENSLLDSALLLIVLRPVVPHGIIVFPRCSSWCSLCQWCDERWETNPGEG